MKIYLNIIFALALFGCDSSTMISGDHSDPTNNLLPSISTNHGLAFFLEKISVSLLLSVMRSGRLLIITWKLSMDCQNFW